MSFFNRGLHGIYGIMGSYKTALMVAYIFEDWLNGITAYTNFYVNLPNVKALPMSKLLSLKSLVGCSVNIDELSALADSRVSSTYVNRFLGYFGFQSRKLGLKGVRYTAQLESSVDLRIATLTQSDIYAAGLQDDGFVEYEIVYESGDDDDFAVHNSYFEQNIFPIYDTNEVIEPIRLDELLVELEKDSDYVSFNQRIDSACDAVLKWCEIKGVNLDAIKVTRPLIDDLLVRCSLPENLGKYVHNRLLSERILQVE